MAARPSFLFAHGAGAPSSSAWMVAWRDRLATVGDVTAFDYPYMRARRKAPDKLPALIAAHREALASVRARAAGPLFLIGKSMGGRVGCHVALEEAVAGVICLGYPLQSGSSGAMRDEVLLALRTPILFVQGSRDALCPLDKLAGVRARMTAPSTLVVVEGGNHSLEVSAGARKASGGTQAESDARVLEAIRTFVESAPAATG
ncbi:MAG TPA: alpha/beta fold hydrolase [Polyangia bacterium]|nr:alpha/beta fold hydrolase [Polyangia bacterium]